MLDCIQLWSKRKFIYQNKPPPWSTATKKICMILCFWRRPQFWRMLCKLLSTTTKFKPTSCKIWAMEFLTRCPAIHLLKGLAYIWTNGLPIIISNLLIQFSPGFLLVNRCLKLPLTTGKSALTNKTLPMPQWFPHNNRRFTGGRQPMCLLTQFPTTIDNFT